MPKRFFALQHILFALHSMLALAHNDSIHKQWEALGSDWLNGEGLIE